MNKKRFQAIDTTLLIRATGNTPKAGIILDMNLRGKTATQRRFLVDKLEVISVGENVKNIKVGDDVIPESYVFNNLLPPENIGMDKEDKTQYYWAKEKDILGINKY